MKNYLVAIPFSSGQASKYYVILEEQVNQPNPNTTKTKKETNVKKNEKKT